MLHQRSDLLRGAPEGRQDIRLELIEGRAPRQRRNVDGGDDVACAVSHRWVSEADVNLNVEL
jgi:hypothetical protein